MSTNQPIYTEAAHAEVDQRLRAAATSRLVARTATWRSCTAGLASHRAG